MSLSEDIKTAQNSAMKSGDARVLNVLRMVTSAVRNAEIDTRKTLTDAEVQDVIRRQVKQLADALKDFEAGKREDLITQTHEEIAVLSKYLPTQLTEADVRAKAGAILDGLKAAGPVNAGQAMGAVMKELKGLADGNIVKNVVSELLK